MFGKSIEFTEHLSNSYRLMSPSGPATPEAITAGLTQSADRLSVCGDLEELAKVTVGILLERLGFERASLWIVRADGSGLRGTYGVDENGQLRDERECRLSFEEGHKPEHLQRHVNRLARLLKEGNRTRSVVCEVVPEQLLDHQGTVVAEGEVANCAIWDGSEVRAVLCADHLGKRRIGDLDKTRLRFLAILLGTVIRSIKADQRKNEAIERADRERLLVRRALDAIPHPILIKDTEHRYLFVNRAKRQLLRVAENHQLEGESAYDHYPSKLADHFHEEEREVMESGRPRLNYKQFTDELDGQPRVFSESKVPLKAANGHVEGIICFQADITELQSLTRQLEREMGMQQTFFSHIPDRIYFKDRQHRFIRVNEAFRRFCDFGSVDDAIGKTDYDLFDEKHAREAWEDEERIMQTGIPLIGVIEAEGRKSGRHSWASTTKMPYRDEAGEIIGTFGISRDITELVRAQRAVADSEQLFRSIWQNSMDGMRLTDENGIIESVNRGFCRIFGVEDFQVIGRPLTVLYEGEDSESVLANYRAHFHDPAAGNHIELHRHLPDGREVWLQVAYSYFSDSQGRTRYLSVFRDVTNWHLDQERRLHIERKLLDAQRLESLGIMAGGIAHDFNNMLGGILGHASLIGMTMPEDAPWRNDLEAVERTCLQASELCQEMLAYSGRGRFEVSVIDLNRLVQETEQLLRASIARSIVLDLRLASNLPPVEVDIAQLRQILLNLTINASESIGERSGHITLMTGTRQLDEKSIKEARFENKAEPGIFVELAVSDNGCGIDDEQQNRIFDPFYTTKFTGRGLGLAAVLGIVNGHKGLIELQSRIGEGTTFRVLIPVSGMPLPAVREPEPEKQIAWKSHGDILLVDDDQTIRTVMSELLRRTGFEVTQAADGLEGVARFREAPDRYRAVVLDLTMPGMDGDKVFEEIEKLRPGTPVVVMSGYTESDVAIRFGNRPLAAFLQKPFRPAMLRQKLRELLD